MSPAGAADPVRIRAAEPADVPLLVEMFGELAAYERLAHKLKATPERLQAALFSERPAAEALIAERAGRAAGYAVFFPTFSTFLSIRGIWLEDVYVRPEHRRAGVARALIATIAARLRADGGERLEWSALDWNDLALDFYAGLGAERRDDWITHELTGEHLRALAGEDAQ